MIDGAHSVIVRVEGEADLAGEAVLRQRLAAALDAAADWEEHAGRRRPLILDLSRLTFCDIRGLSVLIDTVATGRATGITVTVTGAYPTLKRVWRLLASRAGASARPLPLPDAVEPQ